MLRPSLANSQWEEDCLGQAQDATAVFNYWNKADESCLHLLLHHEFMDTCVIITE